MKRPVSAAAVIIALLVMTVSLSAQPRGGMRDSCPPDCPQHQWGKMARNYENLRMRIEVIESGGALEDIIFDNAGFVFIEPKHRDTETEDSPKPKRRYKIYSPL